jgi:hypothetical protein
LRTGSEPELGVAMTSQENSDVALLTTALNHVSTWVETHTVQRQNFINFFLVAMAFLSAAYVAALRGNLRYIAAAVCLIGLVISGAFLLLDVRNSELSHAGEVPLKELQDRLAAALEMDSLRISEETDRPRYGWVSHGNVIKGVHILAMIAFIGAGSYALLARCCSPTP